MYCHGVLSHLSEIDYLNYKKRADRIITCSEYNAHTEPWLKTLNRLKIEDIMKTKDYFIDTNEMNFANFWIQCSLNQMIIIHMILNIIIFYVNYQQRRDWAVQSFFKLYEELLYSEL